MMFICTRTNDIGVCSKMPTNAIAVNGRSVNRNIHCLSLDSSDTCFGDRPIGCSKALTRIFFLIGGTGYPTRTRAGAKTVLRVGTAHVLRMCGKRKCADEKW